MSLQNEKRRKRNSIGESGRKSEKILSKKLDGKQTPASGAMVGAKGDIRKDRFIIEAKSTMKDSYKIDYGVLCKIKAESFRQGRTPSLAVSFINGDGRSKKYGDWVMIELKEYQEFLEYKKREET